MSESKDIQNAKFSTLLHSFEDLGYKTSTRIGPKEFRIFLNKRTASGNFDNLLCDKLFEILNINELSSISIEEFVEGFLVFEEEVARNAESFRIKFLKEQEIYNKILKQCEIYRRENLNAEGFCKNAKISGEITDINIKKKLDGLKEIIIIVIFNNQKEELRFKIGGGGDFKKSFEFRPSSCKDHFEFVMKGLNEKNVEFDIGSKIFPLGDIESQEEYFVQIVVPEIENPDQVAAFINASILLYKSDYKYYEAMLRKQEKRMKKYKNAMNKAAEYLKYVREIYGDLTQIKPDLIVDFNNEKLMQRKGAKLNVNFNNIIEAEVPSRNFYVEFNNQREIKKKGIPLRVEFNNSKEVVSEPIIETKKVEYSYKTTGYTQSIQKQNIVNKTEQTSQLIKNENIDTNINTNIAPVINTTSNIEVNYDMKNSLQQLPEQLPERNVKVDEEIDHIKLYSDIVESQDNNAKEISTNEINNINNINATQEQIHQKQIITQQTQSSNQVQSQSDLDQILQQQNQNQNIQEKQYIQTAEANGEEFDIDAYLKQQGYGATTTQVENNADIQSYLQQTGQNSHMQQGTTTTTTTTKTTTQIQNQGSAENNGAINFNSGEYQLEAKTLEPIINKVGINYSVNKAIVNETTKEIVVSEKTLPVSYLPEKVNKLIVSDQVTTLPLITAGSKVTYNTSQPIVHESKVYMNAESSGNAFTDLNAANTTNASSSNYDYSNLVSNEQSTNYNNIGGENYNYNYDANGLNGQVGYEYNFNTNSASNTDYNNWGANAQSSSYTTTNVVHTTSQSQYTTPVINYQSEIQGIPIEQGQQIQYGI